MPFLTVKNRITCSASTSLGMRRAGIAPRPTSRSVRKACHILYRSELLLKEAIERLDDRTRRATRSWRRCLQFIRESKRGIMRSARARGANDDE